MFTRGFMLDTSAINRIHDAGQCEWSLRGPLYVTDIQLQELSQTRNAARRASLIAAFMSLRPTVIRPAGRVFVPEFFGFQDFCSDGFMLGDEDYPLSLGRVMPHIRRSRRGDRIMDNLAYASVSGVAFS